MRSLLEHAQRELELLGEDQDAISGYLNIIKSYVAMGYSGGMARVATDTVLDLLHLKTLTPLTDHWSEWKELGEGMWQNTRNTSAYSADGGEHYWLLNKGNTLDSPGPSYTSERKSAEWDTCSPVQQSLW